MQHHVKERAKGGVKRINIINIIQGRVLNQNHNNSDDNQCDNSNNTIDLLMLYTTNMSMMFGLYCVTPGVSLSNTCLPNVHIMTIIEVLSLSLLDLFGKCSKRMHIMKLSIMTELDFSANAPKLGVWNMEY